MTMSGSLGLAIGLTFSSQAAGSGLPRSSKKVSSLLPPTMPVSSHSACSRISTTGTPLFISLSNSALSMSMISAWASMALRARQQVRISWRMAVSVNQKTLIITFGSSAWLALHHFADLGIVHHFLHVHRRHALHHHVTRFLTRFAGAEPASFLDHFHFLHALLRRVVADQHVAAIAFLEVAGNHRIAGRRQAFPFADGVNADLAGALIDVHHRAAGFFLDAFLHQVVAGLIDAHLQRPLRRDAGHLRLHFPEPGFALRDIGGIGLGGQQAGENNEADSTEAHAFLLCGERLES